MSVSRTWERIRTVPGLFRDVAVLVVVIVASIVTYLAINANTTGQLPWQDHLVFSAEFSEVPALNPTSSHDVRIAGVHVGTIKGWRATRNNTAIVTFSLDPGVPATIYQNATAVLRSKNPLNEMYIEVDPGTSSAPRMPANGMIPLNHTKTIVLADEALSHLDGQARQALTSLMLSSDVALAHAPEQLPGGLDATAATLVDARPVMEQLQTRREKIAELVTALSQIAGAVGDNHERAAQLAKSTQETLGVLAENDAELKGTLDQLPGLNQGLRDALSSTQPLTKQLNPVLEDLDKASDHLPKALDRFQDTIGKVGKVVDAASPVLREAKPLTGDLRPLVHNLDRSMDDIETVTHPLGHDVPLIENYLEPLRAFVYNTRSVFGVRDAYGGNIRGFFVTQLPDDRFFPGGETSDSPPTHDRGVTPAPSNDRVPNQKGPDRGKNPLLPMLGATGGNGDK